MNVRTTQSVMPSDAAAAVARPMFAPMMRRRSRMSAAERFWIILGSLLGMTLVPAVGIAVLADDGMTGPDPAPPDEADAIPGRVMARAQEVLDDRPGQTSGDSAGSAVPRSGTGQDKRSAADPMAPDASGGAPGDIDPAAIRTALASAGGGSSAPAGFASDDAAEFDPALATRQARVAQIDGPVPALPIAQTVRLPDGWPGLAAVAQAGSDDDTWGISATFLIVSRAQDHMIETGDGVLHMLINRGIDRGLTLISSADDGNSWEVSQAFSPGSRLATSDIRLMDGQDVMIVSYVDETDSVVFAIQSYDALTGTWTALLSTVLDTGLVAPSSVQATVAMSPGGTFLLAYTEEIDGGLRLVIQESQDGGRTWTAAEMAQPGVEAGTARAIAVSGSEGVIYSNAQSMYWVTLDAAGGWEMEVIDEAGTIGRFASHFSTVTFGDDVVVANTGTDLVLRILQFDGETGTWSDPITPLGAGVEISSAQISMSDDTGYIYVTFDDMDKLGRLVVIESRDGGDTWQLEAVLQTPEGVVAPPTRFEAPEHFSGDLVISQQILNPDSELANGLYQHVVDVDGREQPLPAEFVATYADSFIF